MCVGTYDNVGRRGDCARHPRAPMLELEPAAKYGRAAAHTDPLPIFLLLFISLLHAGCALDSERKQRAATYQFNTRV